MTTKKRDMADFPHFDAKTIASPIPQDTLGDRLAFLGMAGSGKTYNAGVCWTIDAASSSIRSASGGDCGSDQTARMRRSSMFQFSAVITAIWC